MVFLQSSVTIFLNHGQIPLYGINFITFITATGAYQRLGSLPLRSQCLQYPS